MQKSIDWEQFSWNIEISSDIKDWTICFELRTWHMVSRKNAPSEYVPDKINIVKIPNFYEIEKICRKRIKENDPTPSII